VGEIGERWDDPDVFELTFYAPSRAGDAQMQEWLGSYYRRSASPKAAADLLRTNSYTDVRDVLPNLRVPTLVLHATADRDARIEEGRYLASHIPGARFVEIPSGDHVFWASHHEEILGEIEEFLTGSRPAADVDRVLATVLFTDIVDSTRRAAALGDRGWRDVVEAHHVAIRANLERYRGTEWDTAGDGFYATFDGPARAVRCGLAARDAIRPLGIEIRAGLHTGECERIAGKLGGIATVIGARVKDQAGAGEVLATSTVRDLVSGSGLHFEDRGAHELKGIPGEWHLFAVS